MSGVRESNSVDMPTSDRDLYQPKDRWNFKNVGLIAGGVLVAVIVTVVLVVVLTRNDNDKKTTVIPTDGTSTTTDETTTPSDGTGSQTDTTTESQTETPTAPPSLDEITLDDILTDTLSSNHFSSLWVTGKEVLVNDAEGLKLYDVLTETHTLLLGREDDDLLSKAYTYSISPDHTHLIVSYERVKGYRHSSQASYSVVELHTEGAEAGKETKIFINDETDKLTLVEWNPTGQGLVIVYENNIYYKPTLVATPIQITTDGSTKIFNGIPDWVYEEEVLGSNSALRFSPDGTKLVYIKFDDTNVETFDYTYYGEPGTVEAQYPINMQVSYPKVGTANPTVSVYQVDLPSSILYPIRQVEITVPTELSAVEHIITTLSWANNDLVVATWMNRVQNHAYIQVCNHPTCSVIDRVAPTDGWIELFSSSLHSEDGGQIALIMSHDQGDEAGSYRHLTLLSTDDGTKIELTKGKYVVTELLYWNADLDYIFYSANTEDDSRVSHVHAIKAELGAESQCLTCDLDTLGEGDYKYFSASFSNDEELFGLNALGPAVPRADIFSYSEIDNKITLVHERVWETNEVLQEKIANLNMPIVEYDDEIELSSGYKAQVSMILPGDIDRSGVTKYPVLVNVYGGPDSHTVTFQWGTNWGTYLAAAKNIIYVRIDGRGSGLRGDKLMHEIYRKLGTVEIEDQIETAKLLAHKYPFIDRNRIAIWGWSYGGYAAALALAKDTDYVFNCAASVAPVTDWTYYDTIYTERYMGLPADNAEGYDASRLSTLYEEFEGKNYFLVHGTLDDNVHYQQAMALSRTLEKHSVLFKQMSYPDEDHSLSGVLPHLYSTLEHYFTDCFVRPFNTQPEPTPPLDEITLDDILTGTLSSKHFSSRWITGKDVLVNDAEGLKLYDVLADTSTLLLAKEDGDLLSKAYIYSLSPSKTHLLVGYERVKGYRHSYQALYSVVELLSDDATSKVAGQEIKIFIDNETDKLSLVEWNPTGQGLVIIYENNIYYKPTLVATPIQITRDGSTKIFNGVPDWVYEEEVFGSNSALRFSPDGTKLAYIRFDDTNVETFEYIYYGEPGTVEAQYPINMQVSYPKSGTANPTVKLYQVDLPSSILYPIRRLEIPVPTELSTVEYIITTLSWVNNDHIVATWMNRVQNDAYIQVCNHPTCSVIGHVVPTDGWVELFSSPLHSEDGSQIALIMSHDQGDEAGSYRHLTLLSTDDSTQIVLTKGKYVVTQLLYWNSDLDYIFYSANTEDDSRVSHIYAIKAELGAESQCLTCDLDTLGEGDYKYFSASFSNDEELFGLNALGPAVPRADIFSYSEIDNKITLVHERVWETNEVLQEKLANLNTPTVEYDDEIELSSGYKAQVSMILPGDIDRSGATKYPVLINVYGGPDSHSVTFQWGTSWGTYLTATKNIIYVRIDGRGSGLRGDKLLNEIYRKLGTVEIEDQIETAKLLAEKYPFIDRDHIAIWGWSYGGYAAGLALAKDTEDVFKCAVSVAPVTDWTYYDTIYTERYMGVPADNVEGYAASRLSTLYEEFEGKNYFLIHGTLDDNVHYQQAMALSRTLEQHLILFKQMSYPDEDHSISGVLLHLYSTLERYFSDCFHVER